MQQGASDLARFLHAVADPARRRILEALKNNRSSSVETISGMCAGDIEECVKLSQPTVSHHMKILERAGLVEVKRDGTWRRYQRNEKLIRQMIVDLKKQL